MTATTAVAVKQPTTPVVITPAIRKRAEEVLKKAKVQLAINHAFFGTIALNRKIQISDNVPTAYITSRGHMVLGTAFLADKSVQQCVFLLAHESMHYAMLHFLRRGARDPRKWNYAGDAVINDILITNKVGEFIPGGVNMPGSQAKTVEKVYEELPEDPNGGGGQGYQPGNGNDDMDDSGGLSDADKREIEEQVRVEMAQANAVAKAQGKLPQGMEKMIDDIINPRTPWHQTLERYMTGYVNADTTWRRPNRRFMSMGMYMPSADRLPAMGTVVIESDESGSIGDKERAHFAGHINSILEKCRPEKVIVLHTDTEVDEHVDEYTIDDLPIKFVTRRCGGTDMAAGVRWCQQNGVEPDVFICLTDGFTPWPETEPFPLVWLITTDVVAPIGVTIPYSMDDQS